MSRYLLTFVFFLLSANLAFADGTKCVLDPLFGRRQVATNAGLHYLDSYPAGITRTIEADKIVYHLPGGRVITDAKEIARIESLGIPKVYSDIWISPDPLSHIQATAKDARGRVQYKYHPLWKAAKSSIKFSRMVEFENALVKVHETEAKHLAMSGLPQEKVLAAISTVMEKTGIRVGSAEYALENETYGLTTFLKSHATVRDDQVTFHFIGKASVEHTVVFQDAKVAEVVKDLKSAPGNQLFQYKDASGTFRDVNAPMLNNYIAKVAGGHFTAKDFRTAIGTSTAMKTLMSNPVPKNATAIEKDILAAIDASADRLGNTRTVARDNYIEPRILEAYRDPVAFAELKAKALASTDKTHTPEEIMMLLLLKQ